MPTSRTSTPRRKLSADETARKTKNPVTGAYFKNAAALSAYNRNVQAQEEGYPSYAAKRKAIREEAARVATAPAPRARKRATATAPTPTPAQTRAPRSTATVAPPVWVKEDLASVALQQRFDSFAAGKAPAVDPDPTPPTGFAPVSGWSTEYRSPYVSPRKLRRQAKREARRVARAERKAQRAARGVGPTDALFGLQSIEPNDARFFAKLFFSIVAIFGVIGWVILVASIVGSWGDFLSAFSNIAGN